MYNKSDNYQYTTQILQSYQWIETLVQTPIQDHRKFTIELVLAPYLINVRNLLFDQTFSIIHDWIAKCDNLRRLELSINNFEYRIKLAINKSVRKHIPPISTETIRKNYPDWYKDFKEWHLFD